MLLYDEGATAEQIRDHGRALVLWSIQTRADDGVTVTSMLLPLKSLSQAFGSSAESLFLVGDNGDKLLQVSFPVNAPPTLGPQRSDCSTNRLRALRVFVPTPPRGACGENKPAETS